jgi:hypothetical protein
MTQSTNSQNSETDDAGTPHPVDVLIQALVALLAPMFLLGAGGNPGFASMAALETIRSYRVQNHASLIKVANIIAFGLATLGSLSVSMQDDLPILWVLRLQSNANALDRSAARNERGVNATQPGMLAQPDSEPRRGFDDAAAQAKVAEASRHAAEFRANMQAPNPRAQPAPARAAVPLAAPAKATATAPASVPAPAKAVAAARAPVGPEAGQYRNMWAAAMADVAAEELADAVHLPPAQRKEMTAKAAILSSTANSLLTGVPLDFASLNRPGAPPGKPG